VLWQARTECFTQAAWHHGKEGKLAVLWLGEHNLASGNSLMSPKTPSPMVAILLIFGGAVFGVLGGLHAIYTLLDLHNPRRLVPVDPAVAHAMANSAVRLSGGGTDMWRAWIGFNFSHSLGVLLFAALAIVAGARIRTLPVGIVAALTLIGCDYLALALRYWFRVPAIGIAIGTGCFAAAWVLSLR
jgi:hypothetical protein